MAPRSRANSASRTRLLSGRALSELRLWACQYCTKVALTSSARNRTMQATDRFRMGRFIGVPGESWSTRAQRAGLAISWGGSSQAHHLGGVGVVVVGLDELRRRSARLVGDAQQQRDEDPVGHQAAAAVGEERR